MKYIVTNAFLIATLLLSSVYGQAGAAKASCSPTLSASYAAPSVADGYVARLVANGLTDPRGIKFDSQGALLVVESGFGITALNIVDAGKGCLRAGSRQTVISDSTLNHGIEISNDGSTLYASSSEAVYRWTYSPASQSNTSAPTTLVTNMTNSDHTTRTLLLSQFSPGLMVVTRGSTSNIDVEAENILTGHSQIKAFNLTNMTGPYDFNEDGLLLGWGLRNDVGIDEDPVTGSVYSVENSVDQMMRNGKDIHQTNPAEELNFLGYLDGKQSSNQGRNFGYPECYTAWDVNTIPDFNGEVGQQFAIGQLSATNNDSMCSEVMRQAARLAFHPHMAPLDILFNDAGTAAWVTFHGSWDSEPPVGYKLSVVEFENGKPLQPSTSKTAVVDVLSNHDVTQCTGSGNCFRPVGLAWDREGRLFMSSDTTGEVYVLLRDDGNATSSAGSNATGTIPGQTASTTGSSASPSSTSIASVTSISILAILFGVIGFLA